MEGKPSQGGLSFASKNRTGSRMNSYLEKQIAVLPETIQTLLKNIDTNVDPKTSFNETIKIYENIKEAFSDGGMTEVKKEMEEMESTELHIAITGESGSGKSSLINALQGLKAEDVGAASVGVTETTLKPNVYTHHKYPKVKFWDLPGIGSSDFSPEDYLKKVDFAYYDFFIIVASERFRHNHTELAEAIQKMEKKCYFVRSKVDSDLYNTKRSNPSTFNEEEVLEKMRDEIKKHLEKRFRNTIPQVFLISSWDLDKYDFGHLVGTLEEDLPSLKRLAFLLSLPDFSPEIIEKKKSALKSHIWKISLVSAGINAIPLPALPLVCDVGLLLGSMIVFYKGFELDDGSLARLARLSRKPVEELQAVIKSPRREEITMDLVIKEITHFAFAFPPLLRSINWASSAMSFFITSWMLSSFLDNLAEDAERVRKKALGLEECEAEHFRAKQD